MNSSSLGYYDNRYFEPARFKTVLPHNTLKDVTRADGFWAAKIMMTFSNSDIGAMVKAGRFSSPEDVNLLANRVAERRDLIGRYWFSITTPLDQFAWDGKVLRFEDLAVKYGFAPKENRVYQVEVLKRVRGRETLLGSVQVSEPVVDCSKWMAESSDIVVRIKAGNAKVSKKTAAVSVEIDAKGLQRISHAD